MAENKYLGENSLSELINLVKADIATKQIKMQFNVMPDPRQYTGKVVQYTGPNTRQYTKGSFYYASGNSWVLASVQSPVVLVETLPAWSEAASGTIYLVKLNSSCWLKNDEVEDAWYSINNAFKTVYTLPAWADALPGVVYYLLTEGSDAPVGYIRSETVNEWYITGGGEATLKKYADSEHYDPSAEYDDEGQKFKFHELEICAFSDQEIEQLYNEV